MRRSLAAAFALLTAGALAYPLRGALPVLLRGVASDFLWAAAFACTLATVMRGRADRHAWSFAGLVVALGLEVAQLHDAIPGTFDGADLLAIVTGWGSGLLVARLSTDHARRAERRSETISRFPRRSAQSIADPPSLAR